VLAAGLPALFVVFANPAHGTEAAFSEWYDHVHGPDALANGSFRSLHRYRAVGPGWKPARFLALWQGDHSSLAEADAYITPRAEALRAAGRVGTVASVTWAAMLFAVPGAAGAPGAPGAGAGRILTTVQSDWRRPRAWPDPLGWWRSVGLDAETSGCGSLFTSDPPGAHLAVFEHDGPVPSGRWARWGADGMSPTPPYQPVFGTSEQTPVDVGPAPGVAAGWVMQWELVSSLA